MGVPTAPFLTRADDIVLQNLLQEIDDAGTPAKNLQRDQDALRKLGELNDPESEQFQATIVTGWDPEDRPTPDNIRDYVFQWYSSWAQHVVRRPTDVVFLTHILLYFSTSIPSVIYLFYNFTWFHGVFHTLMQLFFTGQFTIMLHNHIHNGGVLAPAYTWLDTLWPYILGPLMGHTWNSYYFHHVKHHHVEGNGPEDLSSTIRYQRDELKDLLQYIGRFIGLIWLELPQYFFRKKRADLAYRMIVSELSTYALIIALARYNFRAALFSLILPLSLTRVGLMVGNWGQHAFVDEIEPDSDFRSSITLIDEASNRHCFNDGYHTSHHLNPRRHWRDHPASFLKAKDQYKNENGLVFQKIDYMMITFRLMRKDYDHLAKCFVPIGNQIGMTHEEIVAMLKTKTQRFTEEDIRAKFSKYQ